LLRFSIRPLPIYLVVVVVLGCFLVWLLHANLSPIASSIEQTAENDDDDEDEKDRERASN
jgi:hypothetical protein